MFGDAFVAELLAGTILAFPSNFGAFSSLISSIIFLIFLFSENSKFVDKEEYLFLPLGILPYPSPENNVFLSHVREHSAKYPSSYLYGVDDIELLASKFGAEVIEISLGKIIKEVYIKDEGVIAIDPNLHP
jgi:hypothetical protein